MINYREFWIGWYSACVFFGIIFSIGFYVIITFFPNEFEQKGRKKLCELKQYEYCEKEELLKTIK